MGYRKVNADGKLTAEKVEKDKAEAAGEKVKDEKSKSDKAAADNTAVAKTAKDKEAGKSNRILIEIVTSASLRVLKKAAPVKCDPKTK